MDISIITKVIFKKFSKNGKLTPLSVKNEFSKKINSLYFLMIKESINPNITSHLVCACWFDYKLQQAQRRAAAGRSRHKIYGVIGVVFSHTMPKMDCYHSHHFSWEKNTLNWYITCHGYINNHQSPFIGPIKINLQFWKITPLGSWRYWNEMYSFPS